MHKNCAKGKNNCKAIVIPTRKVYNNVWIIIEVRIVCLTKSYYSEWNYNIYSERLNTNGKTVYLRR